jgi:POT family proton-dependent oligopeptide transporter
MHDDTLAVAPERPGATLRQQPPGLATLFFTEMWERFTYYGMRSVLILFLVAGPASGGLGFDDQTASSIYGLYICATYLFALLGGWIADSLIGPQRAVICGGALIFAGNALLTIGNESTFFLGLLVIVLGVGLLKPNISAMVASIYPEGGSRRDAGFSIFYMGISVGAVLGSFLVPLAVRRYGWSVGFSLAALGMIAGLAVFLLTRRWLPAVAAPARAGIQSWLPVMVIIVAIAGGATLAATGHVRIDPAVISVAASWLLGLLAGGYFLYLLAFAGLSREERRRVWVMIVLFVSYALFYAGFEQGGASMNLFAERYTDRRLFGGEFPAGILQGATALYTILLAPAFAAVWLALGRRGKDPSPPAKFAIGLTLLTLGLLVMVVASQRVVAGHKVLPTWLLFSYLLEECGDLCLSPVGLSSMTKLAPARYTGRVMGLWFMALALGDNLAGQLSREYDAAHLESLPTLFLKILCWTAAAALALFALAPRLASLMRGPENQARSRNSRALAQ